MKKFKLIFTVAILCINFFFTVPTSGQTLFEDDFDSGEAEWTFIKPPSGNGQILIDNLQYPISNDVCYLKDLIGGAGNDNRIYHALSSPLNDNSWEADVEYTHISQGTSGCAVTVLALTAGYQPVSYKNGFIVPPPGQPCSQCVTDQDCIAVRCITSSPSNIDPQFQVFLKNGTNDQQIWGFTIPKAGGPTYKVVLRRISLLKGEIIIYILNQPNPTFRQCFDIPQGITNLSHVQISNCCEAGTLRKSDSKIDDLNVKAIEPCVNSTSILGPDYVCAGTTPMWYYSVNSPKPSPTTYYWTIYPPLPSSDWFGQGTPTIAIGKWGTNNSYTITVTEVCNSCFPAYLTKSVSIKPALSAIVDFNRTISCNDNTNLVNIIQCNDNFDPPLPSNVQQDWEVFQAVTCTEGNYQTTTTTSLRPIGHSSVFTVYGSDLPTLSCNNCYIVRRTLRFTDGSNCSSAVKNHKLMAAKSSEGDILIEDLNQIDEILVYPNPSAGVFNVIIPKEITDLEKLIITDSNGKIVLTEKINDLKMSISIASFPAGIYFIQFIGKNTNQSVQISKN